MLSEEMARKIGGSDVAALVGLGMKRPIDVWSRIVEGVDSGQTPQMKRGVSLEPFVRQMYQEETGARLFGPASFEFPRKPFLRASLDDIAERGGERRVVELKTAHWRMADQWSDDEVPTPYLLQVQWYLRASGLTMADLAVLFSVDDFRVKSVVGDQELQDMLLDAAERFWVDHILTKTPPPPDSSESYSQYLAKRFPHDRGDVLQATPDVENYMLELKAAADRLERAQERVDFLRNQVKGLLGDASGFHGAFGKLSWRANKPTTKTDYKAVAIEIGVPEELIQKHTHTVPGPRVFRVSYAKEQKQ